MAKKMKVVVRRKGQDSSPRTEKPTTGGGCFLPAFVPSSKKKNNHNNYSYDKTPESSPGRSSTPGRKRAVGASTSSDASSNPLAQGWRGNTTTTTPAYDMQAAWESTDVPFFPTTDTIDSGRSGKVKKPLSTAVDGGAGGAGSSNITANFSVGGESSTQPLSSWGSRTSSGMSSTRTPPSPDRSPSTPAGVEQLLTLPAPQDRSDRRRLQYEREKRQRGVYDGELEPAGTRGQEAPVRRTTNPDNAPPTDTNLPQIRSFHNRPPPSSSSDRKNFAGKQVALVLPSLKEEVLAPVPESSSASSSSTRFTSAARAPQMPDDTVPSSKTPPVTAKNVAPTNNNNNKPNSVPRITPPQQQQQQQQQTPRVTTVDEMSSETSSSQFSMNRAAVNQDYLPPVQLHTGTGLAMRGPIILENSRRSTSSNSMPSAYYKNNSNTIKPRTQQQEEQQPQQQQQQQQQDYDDDESTQSDEELRQMQADLMPSFSADNEINRQHERVSPFQSSTRGPSPAAAAAAAAAAATLKHRPPTPPKQHLSQSDPTVQIDRYNTQAMDAVQEGQLNDAVELFAKVLLLQKSVHGDTHPIVASAYHNLGTVQAKRATALSEDAVAQQLCRTAALEAFQAAARTARDSLGSTHPNVAVSLVRIGFLLLHSKQYANALITFAEALRIRIAAFGQNHALTANLYNNLGVCHMHMGEFEQGRRALHTGLGIQRKLCAESDARAKTNGTVPWLELADALFNIGGLCLEWIRKQGPDLRRAEESEDSFSEAYEIRLRILGPDDPSTTQVQELLSIARSIPRPKPRSNSPSPRRWRSEEVVALYEPPAAPDYTGSPSTERKSISPIARSVTPTRSFGSHFRGDTPQTPTTPESFHSRRLTSTTPDSWRALEDDGLSSREQVRQEQTNEIFRTRSGGSSRRSAKVVTPPVMEVSFSQDSDPKSGASGGSVEGKERGATRIYMSSHLVPGAPLQPVDKNGIQHGLKNASFDEERETENSRDTSGHDVPATRLFRSNDYDHEENCLISDSGIDSEHGRVHYPFTWNKAGLQTISESPPPSSRDIVVTRPLRGASLLRSPSQSSERWGSETVNMGDVEKKSYSTGNKERDDIMSRAKAILASHDSPPDLPSPLVDQSLTVEPSRSLDPAEEGIDLPEEKTVNEDLLMEDGLAPLGGKWASSSKQLKKSIILSDPMKNLQNIHELACRELSSDNFVDAVHLFDVILQCQKRRNGNSHADVAAALYNLGIAQLRSQAHGEALKCFEEAARMRKEVLGREHPDVAVSLVKVGITLLLLHRFEEALWSFREGLSVRRHALGPLHPSTARIYNNIGCVHVEFNEFKEARRAFESALEIQRTALCNEPESGPLMFGAATTLCNLGYLYRYRGMHAKAAVVLKEAVDLQETVLGRSHATVLSTLDNLADSCASSGQAADSLRHYNTILTRFRVEGRSGSQKLLRAEAVLLYKMSRVHRQRNDLESQLDSLKLALRAVRALSDSTVGGVNTDGLERRIQYDIRSCRERIEKSDLKWV